MTGCKYMQDKGNEAQKIHKWKRVAYYIKADRARIKKEIEVAL